METQTRTSGPCSPPTVGMVGGGQLARMTASAAARLGITFRVLDPDPACPAAQVGADLVIGDPGDPAALLAFGRSVDVVTFDHERVAPELLDDLERHGVALAPGASVARLASDKAWSRRRLKTWSFPVPRFTVARNVAQVEAFGSAFGWPVMVKAARGGYDGRGVALVESPQQSRSAVAALGPDMVVEEFLPFDRELAVMVARRPSGDCVAYPVVSTVQEQGMCTEVTSPAPVTADVARSATEIATRLAHTVGLVGVMTVELFLVDGTLLVNELATRPHNTGHQTIEANDTSQFEQHLRAVLDLPLGSTALRRPAAAMCNVVGNAAADDPGNQLAAALEVRGAHVHLYGKTPRRGRKLGHVTALGATIDEALAIARAAAERLNQSTDVGARA